MALSIEQLGAHIANDEEKVNKIDEQIAASKKKIIQWKKNLEIIRLRKIELGCSDAETITAPKCKRRLVLVDKTLDPTEHKSNGNSVEIVQTKRELGHIDDEMIAEPRCKQRLVLLDKTVDPTEHQSCGKSIEIIQTEPHDIGEEELCTSKHIDGTYISRNVQKSDECWICPKKSINAQRRKRTVEINGYVDCVQGKIQ